MPVTPKFFAGREYPGLPVDTLNFLLAELKRLGAISAAGAGDPPEDADEGPQSCAWVWGRWTGSGALKPGQPVYLAEALFKPSPSASNDPPEQVLEAIAISCSTPFDSQRFGVLLEPFDGADSVARVAVTGACWAWVNIVDEDQTRCSIVSGGIRSSDEGVEILWAAREAESTKTGEQWCLIVLDADGSESATPIQRFELDANKIAGAATATGWLLDATGAHVGDPVTLVDTIADNGESLTAGYYGRGPHDGPPGADQRGYFGVCRLVDGEYVILEMEPPARFGTATHTYRAGSGTPAKVTALAEQFMGREHPPESGALFQDNIAEDERIPVGSLAIFDELNAAGFKYVDGARMRRFNYKAFMSFSNDTANVAMADSTGAAYDPEIAFAVKNTGRKFHAGDVGWTGYAAEVRGEWVIVASESYPHWVIATLTTNISSDTASATISASWEGEKTPPSPILVTGISGHWGHLKTGATVLARLKSVTSTTATYQIVYSLDAGLVALRPDDPPDYFANQVCSGALVTTAPSSGYEECLVMIPDSGGNVCLRIFAPISGGEYTAGCGISIVANEIAVNAATLAGYGLVVQDTCSLQVNPGCGIDVVDDKVVAKVDPAGCIECDATAGLRLKDADTFVRDLTCELSIAAGKLKLTLNWVDCADATQTSFCEIDVVNDCCVEEVV